MLTYWSDVDRTLAAMEDFRRRVERFLGNGSSAVSTATWPRVNIYDTGQAFELKAELPGLTEQEIDVSLNQDVVTVSGQRKPDEPEGYSIHRQERAPARFSRSFTLPCRIDRENVEAKLKDGILTVTLNKAPESKPRQITVTTA